MAASSAAAMTAENVVTALRCLSGTDHTLATPQNIKEAEAALLTWERCNPDGYALMLLSILLDVADREYDMPRLGAILTLKAAVGRRWKDRGRKIRPRRQGREVTEQVDLLMSKEVKERVRTVLLSIVTSGGFTVPMDEVAGKDRCRRERLALWMLEERSLQATASSVLSKIGRSDLPLTFHNLIPTLVAFATGNPTGDGTVGLPLDDRIGPVVKMNALYALEAVLSELCTKRLLADKNYVASVTRMYLPSLVDLAFGPAVNFVSGAVANVDVGHEEQTERIVFGIEYVNLVGKSVRHLLVSALPSVVDPKDSASLEGTTASSSSAFAAVNSLFEILLSCIPNLLVWLRRHDRPPSSFSPDHLLGLLDTLCELPVEVQCAHPMEFARFLEPFLILFYDNLVGTAASGSVDDPRVLLEHYRNNERAVLPDGFAIFAMRFLSNVIGCRYYVPDESTNEAVAVLQRENGVDTSKRAITAKGDVVLEASTVQFVVLMLWNKMFVKERLCALADIAIGRYMIHTPERLSEWEEDPESFFLSEEHRSAEDDLGACAQNLFCALVESSGRQPLVQRVQSLLGNVEEQVYASRVESGEATPNRETAGVADSSVLLLDSIYIAAGLSANLLEQQGGWTFSAWFATCLAPCLTTLLRGPKKSSWLPVLRRRIIWLMGCNAQRIPNVYNALEMLVSIISDELGPQNDIAVKLTAVEALKCFLHDFEASSGPFASLAEAAIHSLYQLSKECVEVESQSQALSCVPLILSCVAVSGKPVSESAVNLVVAALPAIWDSAVGQHSLLKTEVLSILSCTASLVGRQHAHQLLPIAIPMIDNVLANQSAFLVEHALSLWLTLLRLAPGHIGQLEQLYVRIQALLEQDLEHLKIAMMITEAYILIGGVTFLNSHAATLNSILNLVVGQVRPRGAAYVALVLEALLRSFAVDGGLLLLRGGVFRTMLHSCALFYHDDNTREPERVIVLYLTAISRALLGAPQLLDGSFPVATDRSGPPFEPHHLVNMMFDLFNAAGSDTNGPLRQRVWAMLFLSLLPSSRAHTIFSEHVVNSMDKLLSICLDISTQEADGSRRNVLHAYTVGYDSEEETPEVGKDVYDAILNDSMMKDIAYTSDFRELVKLMVGGLPSAIGEQAHEHVMSTVEPATLHRLNKVLSSQ